MNLIRRVDVISKNISKEEFTQQNKDLFEGIGLFVENLKIELNKDVTPVVKPARRIPLTIRDAVKQELDRLENLGIITKCNAASNWISNIVIVEKQRKKIRICLDPKELNSAIKPLNHPIPSFDELSAKLAGKSIFTVLDLNDGYWQIGLDEDSSKLCTFSTPLGSYRFKRLPFGIKTAPEIFQKYNEENFKDINGVIIYLDDLLIVATNESEHDEIFRKVIEKAR